MSLLFSRRDSGSPFPEPIVPPWPGAFSNGISDTTAMRLDAVWACVRLLSDTVAMLPPLALDERGGTEIPLPARRQPTVLTRPAPDMVMSEWLRQMMISLLLRGNAYAEWTGDVSQGGQLIPLNPDRVSVTVEGGKKVYRIGGEERKNIFHVRGWTYPGDVKGMSPIAYASTMLQTQMAIDDFARGYFSDAPHPAQVYTTDKPVNQTQAKEISDRIEAKNGTRSPLILGLGLKMDTIAISPEESQFLETQQFGVARICRIFGVPPEMIGGGTPGSSVTYANLTQRALGYLIYSVQGWLTRFEDEISMILPRQQHVRFDTRPLVRMSPIDAANVDKVYLASGVKVINDVRPLLGLEPVQWGDEPFLPGMSPAAAGAVAAEPAPADEGKTNE